MKRVVDKKLLGYIASRGCILCELKGYGESPSEVHHIRKSAGMGMKAGDDEAIPLCFLHHRGEHGIHHLGTRKWEEANGYSERDLLREFRRSMDASPRD